MRRPTLAPVLAMLLLAALAASGQAPAPAQTEPDATAEQDAPAPQERERRYGERVSIFSGEIRIPAHVYQAGAVISVGGKVVIEGDVRDDVVVIFGTLEQTGTVERSVVGILSGLDLDGAVVEDQLINIGGTLRHEDTEIGGQFVNIGFGDWFGGRSPFGVLGFLIFWIRLFKFFLAFILILLLAALMPERIRVISDEAPLRYGAAFFVGLLGYLGLLLALVLLSATVIGVPIALLLFIVLKWLGLAGIFHAIGSRLGRSLGRELSLLGAILLVFAPLAAVMLIPSFLGFIGLLLTTLLCGLVWLFLEVPAVGLILLTRAGSRGGGWAQPVVAAPAPPAPPAGPPPAAEGSSSTSVRPAG
jgi:hypothetical protein